METMLDKALVFAYDAHKNQVRKNSGDPYIVHPITVSENVKKYKRSKNLELLMVVGILHDVVEDCDVSIQKIAEKFGYKVAAILEELTNDEKLIKEKGKTEYLIDKMFNMSSYALVIKLCDRLDNCKDLKNSPEDFKIKYTKLLSLL